MFAFPGAVGVGDGPSSSPSPSSAVGTGNDVVGAGAGPVVVGVIGVVGVPRRVAEKLPLLVCSGYLEFAPQGRSYSAQNTLRFPVPRVTDPAVYGRVNVIVVLPLANESDLNT
mmetsp:Transcript_16908/g.29041  ORF Transcript_16908/g.29041 Transcript_16908/m.29041 type:complete len:113 (+) Transcript_16908:2746-3084(+)